MNETNEIPPQVRLYMSKLGKKGGDANKKKGSAFFKWVRSHGTKKKEEPKEE